ncbi:MAG TPA: MFS transporter [Dehalococcoidia bacterium]|nr:MFS transporter [Dehalococcoidia bacterium]
MGENGQPPGREASGGGRLSVLRNRNFSLLWFGQIISNSGAWMQIVAQGWLVYNLTDSPFYLGVVGMARAIPMIVLPPMGGVIADRMPRLKLLKVTQTTMFLNALVLAGLVHTETVQIWQIVLIAFLAGALNSFDQPSRQALLPDLVRREDLAKAVALYSSAWQGASLFGPTLAGITIAAVGLAGAFYANAFGYFGVIAALFLMRGVPERSAEPSGKGLTDDLVAGLRYVRGTRLILALILLSAATNIFGRSYQQLLPVFARDVFDEGSFGLGLMMSAPGAGTLAAAAALAVLADIQRKGVLFLAGMVMFSLTLVVFTLNREFLPGIGLLFLVGVTSILFSSMMTTMLQLRAAPEMRGRVMSLVTVTMQGLAPLGGLMTGSLATAIGTPEAVALSAAVVALVAALAAAAVPEIRDFRSGAEEPPEAAAASAAPAGHAPAAAVRSRT